MKPTLALRSFLLGSISLVVSPLIHAANIWDGGGTDNNSNNALNWDNNVVPTSGTLTFAGTVDPTVVWNGINSVAPINLAGFTFSAGAAAFQINSGTETRVQFVSGGTPLLNNSSSLQTLSIESHVFFNNTKTFNANTAGLALNGGIVFRGDSLVSGNVNRLDLIGSFNSTTTSISRLGGFAGTATTSLVKNGTGKWTITGNVTDTGPTTITQGTLEYQGNIASSSIANNAAMILNNANATSFSYANNITGTGSVTKSGLGTFTLSGAGGYAGATNVNGGKLTISAGNINGTSGISIGAGEFNYNSSTALTKGVSFSGTGGILSGSGTITPAVTITSGNRQTAGTSVTSANPNAVLGNQTFSTSLDFQAGSIFEWNLTANTEITEGTRGTNYDAVDTASLLNTGADAIFRVILNGTENFDESFWNADRSWTDIFKNGGTALNIEGIFGTGANVQYYNSGGLIANGNTTGRSFSITGTTLNWTAVPEPTSALAGLLIGAGLLRRRRTV